MKRSRCVPLVMLGLASALGGCSEDVAVSQDRYTTQADCAKDWGSEQNCRQQGSGSGGGGGTSGYNGPRYYWDRSKGQPVAVLDSGEHRPMPNAHPAGSPLSHSAGAVPAGTVSRGGFGHFGFGSHGG